MTNNYFNQNLSVKFLLKGWVMLFVAMFAFTANVIGQNEPELMYYKFDAAGNQTNSASIPVGTNPSSIVGTTLTIGTPSQFGTALVGTGGSSTSNYVNNGWLTNLTSTDWTIGFWINNVPAGSTLYYLFGDAGNALRFFVNGAPGSGNGRLTGTGWPTVDVTGVTGAPYYLHFVRTVSPNQITVYKNGVFFSTTSVTGTPTVGTGFRIGGYSSNSGLLGQLDEFRLYNRALNLTEISATWNQTLPIISSPCSAPPTAGASTAIPSSGICVGQNIALDLSGNSAGAGQTYQWQSSTLLAGPYTNLGSLQNTSNLSTPATGTLYYRCEVTCSGNSQLSTPVLVNVNPPFAGGTYTINSAIATGGTNFQTFNDAKNALACGISGPVVFDVVSGSGPYNEQVEFSEIGNASAFNTITINGNGNILTFNGTSTLPYTLGLNGTDYLTVNNLNVIGTNATYSLTVHLWNTADNNTFNNCVLTSSTSATGTFHSPFSISGTAVSATATGSSGSNNIITGCTTIGGYYGIVVTGSTTQTNNQVLDNNVTDFYFYGIYQAYSQNTLIKDNLVERPTRTTVSTGYGIYLTTSTANCLVESNTVRNLFGGAPSSTSASAGVYTAVSSTAGNENKIINNLIYQMNSGSGTIYGIYIPTYNYIQVYHNTIVLDHATATAGATYGIYCNGTGVDVKNNIFYVTRGGTGTKYCIYNSAATATSDYNVFYMNAPAGTNYIGYQSVAYATLAAYQTGTGKDLNSVDQDPLFLSPGAGIYSPTNGLVNDIGTPLGVTTDINGAARSLVSPDPGAYEFALGGLDAGISWVSPTSPSTAGLKTITVNISNTQAQTISSVNLSYSDGGAPVVQNFTGLNITAGSNQNLSFTVQYNFTGNANITADILAVNGGSDAISVNNTTSYTLCLSLAGVYTINSALSTGGTNFQTFNDAVTALSCGITAPVVFNVVSGSGPYTEQVNIPVITGSSSTNTVTFNGNGNTLTSAGVTGNYTTLNLNGADYCIFNNLTITASDATNGFAVHLMGGADYNTFSNCSINASLTGTGSTAACVSMSGSLISYSTTGDHGSNNTFTGCTLEGGYFGFVFYGNSASASNNANNSIINCTVRNYYLYGSYNYYQSAATIERTIFERPTRTTLSTFYGVYLSNCNNMLIQKNRIRRGFETNTASTSTTYGIYLTGDASAGNENEIINNVISDINSAGLIYGIYSTGSDYWNAYHNTISLDHTASVTTSTTYGIYSSGTLAYDVRNNIISITRGGTGIKYGVYYTSPAAATSDYNNLYVNASAGTNNVGYNGTAYGSLAAWQAGSGKDANSVSGNPLYFNPAANNYKPTSIVVDNTGTPVGVTDDIISAPRSPSSPDAGAYEFSVAPKDIGVFAFVSPAATGCYTNAETITVQIKNYGTLAIDFAVDPVTVNCDITGQITTTLSASLNSGTLAVNATLNVVLSPTVNGTANGTYTFNAYTVMASDGEPSNDAFPTFNITVGTVAGVVSSTLNSICVSDAPVLSVVDNYGGDIQWQQSTISNTGPWTDVGTNSATYSPGVVTQTTYYRALTVCNANSSASNVVTIIVNNPTLLSTSPNSRCGVGTVNIGATPNGGSTVNWYDSPSSFTILYTGNTFTTPVISSTTTYYAAASDGGSVASLGLPDRVGATSNSGYSDVGLMFDALQSFTLQSVAVYPVATTPSGNVTATIALKNSTGTILQSTTVSLPTSVLPGVKTLVPLNFIVPAGTGHRLVFTSASGGGISGFIRELTSGFTYPYTLPGVASITSAYTSGPSALYYYYFYDWIAVTGCEGVRTAVTATVTPAPLLNVFANDIAVCSGNSTSVSVSSINDPNYTYVWTSNPPGFSATGTGPHTVSPIVTTSYIVTATDNSAGPNTGCVAVDSVVVATGVTLASGTVSSSDAIFCVSGTPSLLVTGSDGGLIQWQSSTVSASGPWVNVGVPNSTTFTPAVPITQTSYFQVRVFCQSSEVFSNVVTVEVVTPEVTSVTGDTRCGAGPVTVQATGSSGTTLSWYSASTGGAPLGTGSPFITSVVNSTNLFVSATSGGGGTATATMPAQSTTFTGNVRGYWFTAPSALTITGLRVPLAGTSQSIAVVRFNGNIPPPTFSTSTNDFVTLFLTQNNPSTGVIPCNLTIAAGDVIGILGQVVVGASAVTSYGPATNPINVTIDGFSVPLTRMLMQFPLTTTAPQALSQEISATSNIGRVEFEYSTGCESPRTAVPVTVTPSPSITATSNFATVCVGGPVTLNVTSPNDPNYTYTWTSEPVGFTASGPGPHTAVPGGLGSTTYTVSAIDNTAGPNTGCGAISTVTVNAVANPLSLAVTSTPATVCEGSDAQLTAIATAAGYTMNTNCSTGFVDISSTGTSVGTLGDDLEYNITLPSFTFNSVSYTTARIGNNGVIALGSTTGEVAITNATLPSTANSAGNIFLAPYWDDLDINLGGTIKTQTVGNVFIIQWTGIDHQSFTTGTITFQVQLNLITGVITYVYPDVIYGSVTYDAGASATIGIQFSSTNALQYSFNTASLVNGQCISFTPNTPNLTYDWTANSTYLSATNIANPIAQGVMTSQNYTLVITDINNGCTKLANYALDVTPLPQPTANSNSPVCEGQSVSFFGNNTASGQTTGNSYSWTGPNGFNDIVQNPTLSGSTSAANGTYTVTVTNQFGCTETATTAVSISPLPALNILSQTNLTCNGGSDGAFTIEVTNGSGFYLYDENGNINFDGSFSFYSAGTYNIQVTDNNSCASTISVTLTQPDPTTIPDAGLDQFTFTGATVTLAGNTPMVGTGTWTLVTGSGTITNPNDPATTVTGVGPGLNTFAWTIENAACFVSNSDQMDVTTTAAPTATLSGTTSICNGQTANLTLDFTGTAPWTYSYSDGSTTFGPFTTSNDPEIVQVTPTVTTTYTLTSVSDNNFPGTVSGNAVITVIYSPPTGSISTITAPTTACVGTIATVTCNAVPGATSYTWSGPSGTLFNGQPGPYSTATNSVSVEFGILSTTSGYNICATAVNACGQSNTRCIWIRGTVSTPAPITGSTVGCPNTTGPYSTSAVVGAMNYFWTATPQMQIISGQGTPNVIVRFLASFSSGSICVVAATACGSTSTARCMTVNKATANPGTMSGPFAQCPGQTGQVFSVAPVAGASTYTWTVPANITLTSGQGTPSITVSVGSSFSVGNICVTATSICGIVSAPRCKTISSVQPNTPGNITGPNAGVCGQSITYSVPSQAGVTSYNWVAPAGATIVGGAGTNTVQVTFASNFTTGQLCVTAENGCGSSTARCVNIKGVPADLSVITGPNPVCSFDAGMLYYINPTFGATGYVWTVPAGASIIAGQTTNAIIVDFGIGGGLITVKALNACGQSGTRTLNVIVNCRMAGSLPNATLNAYPNPVSSDLTIDLDATASGSYAVELLDLSGRVVKSEVMNAIIGLNRNSMDVSTLAKGMYMLNVKNEEGFSQQLRIAVE